MCYYSIVNFKCDSYSNFTDQDNSFKITTYLTNHENLGFLQQLYVKIETIIINL